MPGRRSKNKGANFERRIAGILNKAFDTDRIRRTPASGALGLKGDLCTLEGNFELPGPLSNWNIECKKQEKINIWACIHQAQQQRGGKKWLLVFSRNHESDYVCLDLHDYIELVQGQESAIRRRAEQIMNEAHLKADHFTYDLMRTVLGDLT